MSRKTYRICLLVLIAAGMVGGLLFYRFSERNEQDMCKGVLVKQIEEVEPEHGVSGEKKLYEG